MKIQKSQILPLLECMQSLSDSVSYGVTNKMYQFLATKWYIKQDKLLQSIKEMKVIKSRLPF